MSTTSGIAFDALPDEPLTTKEGWSRWVHHDQQSPKRLSTHLATDPLHRMAYDEARLDYLSDPIVVNTPLIQKIIKVVRRLLILNRRQVSARRGLIITGDGGTGKTTSITQLGRAHELGAHLRRPDSRQHRIPVVHVTVPMAATPRMLATEFARFLGLPVVKRDNITDIVNAVCRVLCHVRCDLVLVDEMHNLNLATRAGAEVSDLLKHFSERLPATFVYAGIDVEGGGLFSGIRSRQIASRFATLETRPFAYGTQTQRDSWRSLVLTFEQALPLHRHQPGALARNDEFLYRRTSGMLGSPSHLIRGAAVDAILDGTEKINKRHLQDILLDHQVEHATSSPAAQPAPRRKGAA